MSFVPSRKNASLEAAAVDRNHFMMMCQLIAGISCYLSWLSIIYLATDSTQLSSDELRVAVALGVGFGQLTMTGFWLAFGFNIANVSFGIAAIALEILALVFFSTVSARFIPPSFVFALSLACLFHLVLVWGTAKIANKLMRVSLLCSGATPTAAIPKAQYRIRDLLVAMAVFAVFASLVLSKRSEMGSFSGTLEFFGLIVCFYNLLTWPCIVACLGRDCKRNAAIAIPVMFAVFILQWYVFSKSFEASGGSWLFFICLDLPYLTSVFVHSLVARRFGYRFKTTDAADGRG